MKLNHLNLTVSNVLETHRFLQRHFGLKGLGGEPSEARQGGSHKNHPAFAHFFLRLRPIGLALRGSPSHPS